MTSQNVTSPVAAARSRASARLRALAPRIAASTLLALILLELAARMLVHSPDDGLGRFQRFTLLPYRPAASALERWCDGMATAEQIVLDPLLGWTIGTQHEHELYESNSQGIRARGERVFGPAPPPDRLRIATVGDSFTYSDDVVLEDSWQVRLEERGPGFEVLNFGVPGYGTDQAFLRWQRDASAFAPEVVVLGIWPENVCRNLNQNRFLLTLSADFGFKPRFVLEGGQLQLIEAAPNELESLSAALLDPLRAPALQHERWLSGFETTPALWQRSCALRLGVSLYNYERRREQRQALYDGRDREGIELTVAIAQRFAAEVLASEAEPVVLVFPMLDLLTEFGAEQSLPITRELALGGLDVIDLAPDFATAVAASGADEWFQKGRAAGHLTAAGNELVAERLYERYWARAAAKAATAAARERELAEGPEAGD